MNNFSLIATVPYDHCDISEWESLLNRVAEVECDRTNLRANRKEFIWFDLSKEAAHRMKEKIAVLNDKLTDGYQLRIRIRKST